jgi:hypothetical protein
MAGVSPLLRMGHWLPVTIGEWADMRASKRRRNARPDGDHSVLQVISRPVVPTDIKFDIARVVRTFDFSGVDWGTCLARAALGNGTLIECGLTPRLVAGGMLY